MFKENWRSNFRHSTFRKGQESALDKISSHLDNHEKFIVAEIPTGCVAWDTIIRISRATLGRSWTIKNEWLKQEGKYERSGKIINRRNFRQLKNKNFTRGLIDKESVGLVEFEKVVHSGFKECLKLTSESGISLTLTPDHLVYSDGEWVKAKDMLGKNWSVDTLKPIKRSLNKKIRDSYICYIPNHPNAKICNSKRDGPYKKIARHIAIYEAHINNMSLEEFVNILKTDKVASKKLKFVKKGNHVHHRNGDHYDNNPENLVELSAKDHMKEHSKNRYKNFSQGIVKKEKVVNISNVGVVEVFDLYKSSSESFTANGVVVHNCGKSDIAMALAKSANSAYVATSQNPLIDQYAKDFNGDPSFRYIKGRRNYQCQDGFKSCLEGSEDSSMICEYADSENDEEDAMDCPDKLICPYRRNRQKAVKSPVALTNLTYFALMGISEGSIWEPRRLAVIDEAHNLANEVLGLVSFNIDDSDFRRLAIDIRISDFFDTRIREVEIEKFFEFIYAAESAIKAYMEASAKGRIHDDQEMVKKMIELQGKFNWFYQSIDENVEWIVDLQANKRGNGYKLMARPLESSYFAQNIFFKKQADQYLLQSATIIKPDQYAKDLGIEDYKYVEEGTPFNVWKNRPVFLLNSGKMNRDSIDTTLPNAVMDMGKVFTAYRGKRGLVHTTSYQLQEKLKNHFGSNPRCIFMTPETKDDDFQRFHASSDAILFSPSLMEGFDGKGDILRFQILMRIPYPSLEDRRIKIKAERDKEWYIYQTCQPLIQSVGRGMRSEDDWCDYYVVDSNFLWFANRNLPKSFTSTIVQSEAACQTRLKKMYLGLV